MKLTGNKEMRNRVHDKLGRIELKIDRLADSHIDLYQEQAKLSAEAKLNRISLEEHMRRTAALEKQVGLPYLAKIIMGVGTLGVSLLKILQYMGY